MNAAPQVEPFDYVIFGGTGDLAMRKLLPAFYHRFLDGDVPDGCRIVGTARAQLDRAGYQARIHDALKQFVDHASYDEKRVRKFLECVFYLSLDGSRADSDWDGLSGLLEGGEDRVRVFYFATAPRLYEPACANLHEKGFVTAGSRVVLEKPIGTDLASAEEINAGVARYFDEKHIFRIDHYLGKETVQDVLALRFANPVFEAVWSGEYIQSIQITAAETVGVEARAAYYDTSGATRDMVQNHLLQVLCLCAMEAPKSLEADDVRDAKVAVLKALHPMTDESVRSDTVRAQYQKGEIAGHAVPGYLEELGHPSHTETYVALRAEVETPRWKDVSFYIRTAKRMKAKTSEIVVTFRASSSQLFPGASRPNILVIRVQPDEGLSYRLSVKDPQDDTFTLRSAEMNVGFPQQFGVRYPDSYERLLLDAVRGNPILFIRRDEVEAAWRWIGPVLDAWARDVAPMSSYVAGSWGPDEATRMLDLHGDVWHEAMDDM
ncbi:glucose-6-phosphate dehydrogenase [Brytella acorum]|uniref:Glucose-6-phosphate 1-dehydrogenase n=1 Tax=Brytella acorum TaxID=2959299 RepID=A0AA35Y3K0_9PROT|nr:glucose-6-phosphate dehydrogenase [Brytella acorum]MDF3625414.1 glucose-6-phosphate dehydrogenase [Brytella acorum]CAI9120265.1 glucose-6-phosphate dehydrogenase [Brytella acorum]